MEKQVINDPRIDSFLTKEKLIAMLNGLDFKYVNNLHLELITDFLIKHDPTSTEDVIQKLYYTIDIS